MNLLIFSPYYPPHIGGLESHADEFNQCLSKKGVLITVFTPQLPKSGAPTEIMYEGVEIIRFPAFALFHNYPLPKFWKLTFWKMWRSLFRQQPDIVISRTRFFFTSLMAWWYARARKVPWLHIEHGSDFVHFHGQVKKTLALWYDKYIGSFVLNKADNIVANSEASSSFVQHLSKRSDCQVIYRGVNRDAILKAPRDTAIMNKAEGKVIVGFIGRLIDGKGAQDLLRALHHLPNTYPFLAVFVGDGPDKKKLEKQAKEMGLKDNVLFLGYRNFLETMGTLQAFDIFVNPSYTEGIPTTVIEAALLKKAVIATDVGGTKEIITGDNGEGSLITPGNVTQLTQELLFLLKNSEARNTSGMKSYEKVKNKFSWETASEQYLQLFDLMLKNKSF